MNRVKVRLQVRLKDRDKVMDRLNVRRKDRDKVTLKDGG